MGAPDMKSITPTQILYVIASFMVAMSSGLCRAAPIGGSVQNGDVEITYDTAVTRIVQKSPNAIIQWSSFNLRADERLEIVQPSQHARLVNRVSLKEPSIIEGSIVSNGQVILLNADGVVHQSSANAQVGGLILAGLDLQSVDNKANILRFLNTDTTRTGEVKNLGTIGTAEGGNAVLVGKKISNQGLIKGEQSSVALAVGRSTELQFETTGLVNLRITDAASDTGGPLLQNIGEIISPSGRIFLSGSASSRVFHSIAEKTGITLTSGAEFSFGSGTHVANYGKLDVSSSVPDTDGVIRAGHIVVIGDTVENYGITYAKAYRDWSSQAKAVAGQIVVAASSLMSSTWDSSLSVEASGFEKNGLIQILGKNIQLSGSLGAGGGGTIQIGGKGTIADTRLADTERAFVDADLWGDDSWDTAKFGVWALEDVELLGYIYVQPSSGGAIEIISGNRLKISASLAASNSFENPGTVLLQAKDISVAYAHEPWSINVFSINDALRYAKVTIKADRNLTVAGSPSSLILGDTGVYADYMTSLSLLAGHDLRLQNLILTNVGEMTLSGGNDLYISKLTATSPPYSSGCHITAGGNAYLSNSLFFRSYWCGTPLPEAIGVGGELHINNVLFYK